MSDVCGCFPLADEACGEGSMASWRACLVLGVMLFLAFAILADCFCGVFPDMVN